MIENIYDINIINMFLSFFNQNIKSIDEPFKKYIGYRLDNKIVAFLNYSLIYDRIEIEYIYTIEEYRNQSIASNLLKYVINEGMNKNCKNITLEVRKSNISAIKFYKKHQFKEVSIRQKYYKDEDGILMLRELV